MSQVIYTLVVVPREDVPLSELTKRIKNAIQGMKVMVDVDDIQVVDVNEDEAQEEDKT